MGRHHGYLKRLKAQEVRLRRPARALPQEEKVRTRSPGSDDQDWDKADPHRPSPRGQHQAPCPPSRVGQLRLGIRARHPQDPYHRCLLQLLRQRARPNKHPRKGLNHPDRRYPLPPVVRGPLRPSSPPTSSVPSRDARPRQRSTPCSSRSSRPAGCTPSSPPAPVSPAGLTATSWRARNSSSTSESSGTERQSTPPNRWSVLPCVGNPPNLGLPGSQRAIAVTTRVCSSTRSSVYSRCAAKLCTAMEYRLLPTSSKWDRP